MNQPEPYQQANVSANNFEQCTKCTVCTVYCPVTMVNPLYPGPKQAGPDGERYRLKEPQFYNEALKYCLNCKRCEVACPSDVKIGDIILEARLRYAKGRPSLRDTLLASTDTLGTLANRMAPVVNGTLSLKPVKYLMDKTLGIHRGRQFPAYTRRRFTTWYRRHAAASQQGFDRRVVYFHGCYAQYNYPQLGRDLVRVMNALGYGVMLMEGERCCGVAKISNRLITEARRDAERNLEQIRRAVSDNGGAPVLATSSTCCFTIRDEYPHVLGLDNDGIRSRVMLATRFIHNELEQGNARIVWRDDFRLRGAYHTACHMEKLGWQVFTTSLLGMIPGYTPAMIDSACCGIAGTYGFKRENYDYSQAIGRRLFRQIEEADPETVVTECETCKWQIEMSTPYPVVNPVSVIARAIDFDATCRANGVDPTKLPDIN